MFQSNGLFGQTNCPDGEKCRLLNCIFQHNVSGAVKPSALRDSIKGSGLDSSINNGGASTTEPPRKKQKIIAELPASTTAHPLSNNTSTTGPGTGVLAPNRPHQPVEQLPSATIPGDRNHKRIDLPLNTTQRRISPPPARGHSPATQSATTPRSIVGTPVKKEESTKVESLYPRLVAKPPATHAIRTKLLQLVHEQFRRLNDQIQTSADNAQDKVKMSTQQLIKLALDEEERTAKSNVTVYPNVMKLRITALKKMKVEAWREERVKALEREAPGPRIPKPIEVNTGLTSGEEIALLPNLVASQDGLAQYGYVTSMISQDDIAKARLGVDASHGYEVCDRCGTRFQVFPGRREDGTLATGGSCTYHFGRLRRHFRAGAPVNETERYTCCQDVAGSKGCEVSATHVFKVSDPKRLALILPFEETPTVGPRIATSAVCFDCEMGYTTYGVELIRLTATEWPSGKELLDVLVRPFGEILDLNSRFSGVWPEDYTKALPYGEDRPHDSSSEATLRIAASPRAARDLLFQHLTTTTPLIGHALENDLNAARILHPTIIDTVLLYPHPRGLPIRNGLKALMKQRLNRFIQMGGAQGHDSKEDARAAGELVRLKVAERWKLMRHDGWTVTDGVFNPPKAS